MRCLRSSLTKPVRVRSMIIGLLIALLAACTAPITPSQAPKIPPSATPRPPNLSPTITPTLTSMPGTPILGLPEDRARLPQPVPPDHWDFSWSGRTGPCIGVIEIEGPNNLHISATVNFGNSQDAPYQY